jgi:hypothetical protein
VRDLKREGAVRAAVAKGGVDAGERLTFAVAELTNDTGWDGAVKGCTYVLQVASPLGTESPRDPNTLIVPAHVRAMTAPGAGGERLIASGAFMWMEEIAQILRGALGERANRVPTRTVPDFMVRIAAVFNPELRQLLPLLGRKNQYAWAKATRLIGYKPRPAVDTVVECAESLFAGGAVKN